MRECHEVASAPTTASSTMTRLGERSCEDEHDYDGRQERNCVVRNRHSGSLLRMRGGDNNGLLDGWEQRLISLTPSLVVTVEEPLSTSIQSKRTSTISPLSTRAPSSSTSSSTSSSIKRSSTLSQTIASDPGSATTTVLTVTITPTNSLSPRTSSSFSSSTHTFTPTGYQSLVPTYPPFSFSSSSSSSSSTPSTTTTNWSSLGTKLGLGLGIPLLVLLTLLLTILLHRRQARQTKHSFPHHSHNHRKPPPPQMAFSTTATSPHLYPAPSSRFSTAGELAVTPAPGTIPTPMPTPTPIRLYFPPSPTPSPPAVPRRSSARLLFAGPLNSHPPPPSSPSPPPPMAIRPASSIYDEGGPHADYVRESAVVALGGNGVDNVLAEYLDTNSPYLNGPWDPGLQVVEVPALSLPPKPIAWARHEGQGRQYLSVDVHHSPGGMEEVSPLSSSGSGPYVPARISGMSGMSPVSPGRTRSRRIE